MEKPEKILEKSAGRTEGSELFYMKTVMDRVSFEANRLESINSSQSEGIALRVKKEGKSGFATSTVIDESIIESALETAEFGEKLDFDFPGEKVDFSEESYKDEFIKEIDPASFINRGIKIIEKIRDFDSRVNDLAHKGRGLR